MYRFTHALRAHVFCQRLALLLLVALVLGVHVPPAAAQGSEPPLLPGPAEPSNHGPWFQVICPTGQRSHDDPIVFPGQAGAAHEHQFFGNRTTDAFSTYERLRAGGTTCKDSADTSAYWVPALYDANGVRHTPRRLRAYYYAHSDDKSLIRPFPANLRIIAGSARATEPQPRGVINWLCRQHGNQGPNRPLASSNPPRCDRDEYLSLSITFPDCWDGVNLDSSDHRRHMAYADARKRCPATHPVKLPRLRLSVTYEDKGFTGGTFTLGGPKGDHHALPSTAMHADFWNAWRPSAFEEYLNGCLRRGRTVRANPCT
jgi:hypothetical protein